jgi:hypothetical protein
VNSMVVTQNKFFRARSFRQMKKSQLTNQEYSNGKKRALQILFLFFTLAFLSFYFVNYSRAEVQALGPLRVLPSNPRYFTDGSGKAVYLTGSHTHRNLMDWGYTDPPALFDYIGYLNFLVRHNHNFIRLWTSDVTQWTRFSDPLQRDAKVYVAPFPWARVGPGIAQDGKLKFDLNQFNQTYFERLRQRVIEAGSKNIYVSIMLFEGHAVQATPTALAGHPFNAWNNINNIHVDQNGDGFAREAYNLSNAAITAVQEAYVKKIVDTIGDLNNVLFEICNECPSDSAQWQYHLIRLIKEYEATKPKQHPVGMTALWADSSQARLDLYNSNADWISPPKDDPPYDSLTNPMPADGRKVVILDSDHITYFDASAAMIWKQFFRGMNPIFMDLAPPLRDKAPLPEQNTIRAAMGYTLRYANKINLPAMAPRGDLTSAGYALANPGSEYLIYQLSGDSFSVNLHAGTYNYEWFNPGSGNVAQSGSIAAAGGNINFQSPFDGAAVLYLQSCLSSSGHTGGESVSQACRQVDNSQPVPTNGYLVPGGNG